VGRVHVGVDGAGLDDVDGDAARAEFPRQALGEGGQRGLRQRVDRQPGPARDPVGEVASDVDDAAALAEVQDGGLARQNRGANVDVQEGVDVCERHVLDLGEADDPSVVDEDVQAAERLDGLADGRPDRVRVGAVGLDGDAAAAPLLDGADHPRGGVRRLLVGDGHVGALGGQGLGDCGADAAACTGDEGALSLK
jgi:hypothetical protein